ncbi:MAG: transcription termination/antitermination protein NusA [Muribaculaceae bacterium]|jgi:N utilization substance protein A|nr:transcription termination/antitermination protein NusA [Muribaculaceae bacterium]MBR5551067.1 transcription termination/antitermination protein NusA [Muribaculaceae bacterium]
MAKKEVTPSMVEQFAEFKNNKHIDKATMVSVLEDSFRSVLTKMLGTTDVKLDIILNADNGDVQILQNLTIVPNGEVENPHTQISLDDAHSNGDPDAEVGEDFTKEIVFADFGRRAILNLRQTLQSKILDLQKEAIYAKFKELEGDLVSGEVYQTWRHEILLLDDDKNELLLPKSETINGDFFRKGETVRAVVANVDNKNNNPKITVSRTNEQFLRRLFELEVPEIHDGLINIRAVARIPGERAKIAVESYDDRIDAVGACVGVKGSRIHGIVRELRNENIDVINYSSNPEILIGRALNLSRVPQMRLNQETKKAEVFLHPDEISLAIGKGGLNIKLASMITGYEIDVYREGIYENEEDIYLDDFSDEIDSWIIDALKNIGCITAKAVINTPRQDLIDKADLEEDTVDEILQILNAEFED